MLNTSMSEIQMFASIIIYNNKWFSANIFIGSVSLTDIIFNINKLYYFSTI